MQLLTLRYSSPRNYDAEFMDVIQTSEEGLLCCCHVKNQHSFVSKATLWRVLSTYL